MWFTSHFQLFYFIFLMNDQKDKQYRCIFTAAFAHIYPRETILVEGTVDLKTWRTNIKNGDNQQM